MNSSSLRESSAPDSGFPSREDTTHRQRPSSGTPPASSSLGSRRGGSTRKSAKSHTDFASSQTAAKESSARAMLLYQSPRKMAMAAAGMSCAAAQP